MFSTPSGDVGHLRRAWVAGAAGSMLVFVWLVTAGRWDFTQQFAYADFFDAQARAIFDFRVDVPAGVAGVEGFVRDGKTYIYFGVFPALLRMPVLASTDALDGRLTTLSMMLAVVVLSVAVFRLSCVLRSMLRGDAPVERFETWATAALAIGVLAGPPLFLGSGALVYNEAILWGLALSMAGYDAVARWQREPTGRRLVVAGLFVTLAMLSRQTVALGPLVALVLAGAVRLRQRLPARVSLGLAVACLVPLVSSVGLHYARLGVLTGLPGELRQPLLSVTSEHERDALMSSKLISLGYITTTTRAYLRPLGIATRPDLPWIDFPKEDYDRNTPNGFSPVSWTASLPSTAPALTLLALGGGWWAIRRRHRGEQPAGLSPLVIGSFAGATTVMVYVWVAHRYVADLYPVVLVGGLIGFHALGAAVDRRSRVARRAWLASLAGLVAVGGVVNLALALEMQRERWPVVPEQWRAEWVDLRSRLPGGSNGGS